MAKIVEPKEVLEFLPKYEREFLKQFIITGTCRPKSRPKFGRGRAYMPKEYEMCKEWFMIQFAEQAEGIWQLEKCQIDFKFVGTFRGDPDNIMGTYFDAMQQVGILKTDAICRLPMGGWSYYPGCSKVPFAVLDIYNVEYIRPKGSRRRRALRSSS